MQRMSVFVAVAILLTAAAPAVAAQPGADAVLGLWATAPDAEDGNAHVEVYLEDGRYHGRLVWLEKPRYNPGDPMAGEIKVDRENPDPALRDRLLEGLVIVQGFRYAGDGKWDKGTIYDPDNGKTYKSTMRLDGDVLKVRGFIGFSLLGRTSEWTRLAQDDGSE